MQVQYPVCNISSDQNICELVENLNSDPTICKLLNFGESEDDLDALVYILQRIGVSLSQMHTIISNCKSYSIYRTHWGTIYGILDNAERKKVPLLHVQSAEELYNDANLSPPLFLVDDLVQEGLVLLSAPPKYGKSFLCLDLCLSVTNGIPFLGHATHQAGALYLALEDTPKRLKFRLHTILDGRSLSNFNFACNSSTLSDDLIMQLETYLQFHSATRLIVIDIFELIRGGFAAHNDYSTDYAAIAPLQNLCKSHSGLTVILVTHNRKLSDPSDRVNEISGSVGKTGSVDSIMILHRESRSSLDTILSVTGRDTEPIEIPLTFDPESCRFRVRTLPQSPVNASIALYESDPLRNYIRNMLSENPIWSGSFANLKEAYEMNSGAESFGNSKAYRLHLKQIESLLASEDDIHVDFDCGTVCGGAKKVMIFRRPTPDSS